MQFLKLYIQSFSTRKNPCDLIPSRMPRLMASGFPKKRHENREMPQCLNPTFSPMIKGLFIDGGHVNALSQYIDILGNEVNV